MERCISHVMGTITLHLNPGSCPASKPGIRLAILELIITRNPTHQSTLGMEGHLTTKVFIR